MLRLGCLGDLLGLEREYGGMKVSQARLISFTDLPQARPTSASRTAVMICSGSVSLPSHPDLLAEKLQTSSILTLHLVSFQGVRSLARGGEHRRRRRRLRGPSPPPDV